MVSPEKTNSSKYIATYNPKNFLRPSSRRVVIAVDEKESISSIAAVIKHNPYAPQSSSHAIQSPCIDVTTPSTQGIAKFSVPDKRREQCRKRSPKQDKPEPDLRLSFLGAGEVEKPQSEKMGLSNAFADRCRTQPNTLVKHNARRELGQRMEPKEKGAPKKGGIVIDFTTSDTEKKASDGISVDVGRSDDNVVAGTFTSQETKQQEQTHVSGNGKKELSEEEIQRLLWKYVVRAREKEAAELKARNEKAVQEGRPIEQATPDSWSDSEVGKEEAWTLDEDEELARWKLGGFSDEQLDWPTFHESRTWEDLMARLAWLETRHPKCWAVLEVLEDEEQESFERELSVEILDMKAQGLLPRSSDEMSDDGTGEKSAGDSDEVVNGE